MQELHFGKRILSIATGGTKTDYRAGRSHAQRAVQKSMQDLVLNTQSTPNLLGRFPLASIEVVTTLLRLPSAGRLNEGAQRIVRLEMSECATQGRRRTVEVSRLFGA